GRPEILILDEPGNGLDPRQIIEMRDLIRSFAGSFTVLVTSHILGEIERVADRVAILLGGRLLGVSPPPPGGGAPAPPAAGRGAGARRACSAAASGVSGVSAPPPGGRGPEPTPARSCSTWTVPPWPKALPPRWSEAASGSRSSASTLSTWKRCSSSSPAARRRARAPPTRREALRGPPRQGAAGRLLLTPRPSP